MIPLAIYLWLAMVWYSVICLAVPNTKVPHGTFVLTALLWPITVPYTAYLRCSR